MEKWFIIPSSLIWIPPRCRCCCPFTRMKFVDPRGDFSTVTTLWVGPQHVHNKQMVQFGRRLVTLNKRLITNKVSGLTLEVFWARGFEIILNPLFGLNACLPLFKCFVYIIFFSFATPAPCWLDNRKLKNCQEIFTGQKKIANLLTRFVWRKWITA